MTRRLAAFRRLPFAVRAAVTVWVLLLLGVAGRVAFSKPTAQTVVPIYLNGSQRWVEGQDLYEVQRPLDVYRNPPGFAAAFVPFSLIPEKAAGIAWRLLSSAVFLVGLGRWARFGLPRPLTLTETAYLFLLAAPLALPSLNNGQTNLIVAGFLVLGASAAGEGRWRTAGLWLAAAAAVKVYPLAVGLLVGLGAPRRCYTWLAVGCAAAVAFPFFCQNPGYVLDMYRSLAQSTGTDDRTFADPPRAPKDLFLVLRVWLVEPPPAVYTAGKLLTAGGMAALVWWAGRRTRDPRVVAPLALHLGCLWITVLGPATEVHTYTLLAPTAAVVVLFAFVNRREDGGYTRLVLGVLGYLLVISPVIRDMFPRGAAFQGLGPQPAGGVLVLAVVVWSAVRQLRTGRPLFDARAGARGDMMKVCPTPQPPSAASSPTRSTPGPTANS
jgi:hypothetical protein